MSNDLSRPAKLLLDGGKGVQADDETTQEYEGRLVLLLTVLEIALQIPDPEYQLDVREAVESLRGDALDMMFDHRLPGAYAKGVGSAIKEVTSLLYKRQL